MHSHCQLGSTGQPVPCVIDTETGETTRTGVGTTELAGGEDSGETDGTGVTTTTTRVD